MDLQKPHKEHENVGGNPINEQKCTIIEMFWHSNRIRTTTPMWLYLEDYVKHTTHSANKWGQWQGR